MEAHYDYMPAQTQHSEPPDVEKKLSDSDKELLNLIAEIIVTIILEEEEWTQSATSDSVFATNQDIL